VCVCLCIYTFLCSCVSVRGRVFSRPCLFNSSPTYLFYAKIPAPPIYVCVCVYTYIGVRVCVRECIQHALPFYGVASIRRLLQIIGLFCKIAQQKRLYSSKETYDSKEPTNRSHPIPLRQLICFSQKFWLCQYICVHVYIHICVFVCV